MFGGWPASTSPSRLLLSVLVRIPAGIYCRVGDLSTLRQDTSNLSYSWRPQPDLDADETQDPDISKHGHSPRFIHADKYRDFASTAGRTPLSLIRETGGNNVPVARIPTQNCVFSSHLDA
ncbi:hypothetical protein CLIM01_13649 [Colletotrichum limetticola]|uniref:Uncharacterized protein n=1 Tax=Colletotrichum limetticola TaxID=1209924 RepID=A0ABQ9PA90_9PEZI|nr:hypothetical protein CLIM01_13649 [Colletotrichum limetticola]